MLWVSTGSTLRANDGATFWFDPGAPCLDLTYTGGQGPWAPWERLHRPEDWRAWLAEPGHDIVLDTRPRAASIARARALREVVRRIAEARAGRGALDREDIALLNVEAALPGLAPRLNDDLRAAWSGPVTLDRVVASLARDAVDLFALTPADRFRICAADDCPLLFVDASRPGQRRWCSMERCGNRSKVRRHRSRG